MGWIIDIFASLGHFLQIWGICRRTMAWVVVLASTIQETGVHEEIDKSCAMDNSPCKPSIQARHRRTAAVVQFRWALGPACMLNENSNDPYDSKFI